MHTGEIGGLGAGIFNLDPVAERAVRRGEKRFGGHDLAQTERARPLSGGGEIRGVSFLGIRIARRR